MIKPCFCSKIVTAVHHFGYKVDHDYGKIFLLTRILQIVSFFGRFLSVVLCKIMISEGSRLDHEIWFSPKGNIIFGARSIGLNSVIHHNVTIGMGLGNFSRGVSPIIGNNVWIGPDSIIHGNIVVGDGVTLLAGTVLASSISSSCVVAGNPARIVIKNFDNFNLRSSSRYDITLEDIKTNV